MVLGNAEIERYEDKHTGIFETWDGFYGRAAKPTARQVRDLVALGLVGHGMTGAAADALVAELGPEHNPLLYKVSQGLLGVAFMPDSASQGGDEPAPPSDMTEDDDPAKKTDPAPGTCGE
ncbi:hypothetical protein DL239_20165 [Sedimentitalea sp. CY04]|uniref:Phage tail tube protein, GTA-gp10 n=2 Tax=Parasedimentitalea denitrificans TaxID=2211118 RepID=A0ABX0WFY8_9RHOB|nr:hypothetical protein [Sedimentitalea sp. CY04]